MKRDGTIPDDVVKSVLQVGLICSHWAYVEWLLEITLWWTLGLLNKKVEGRVITGSLSIDTLALRLTQLSHLKLHDEADRKILEDVRKRIMSSIDERNLAVHGVRSVMPDGTIQAEVARGPLKSKFQVLSLVRLRSLNTELGVILGLLEPLLVRHNVISGMTGYATQLQLLRQETDG